jgi:hypothetical protein
MIHRLSTAFDQPTRTAKERLGVEASDEQPDDGEPMRA